MVALDDAPKLESVAGASAGDGPASNGDAGDEEPAKKAAQAAAAAASMARRRDAAAAVARSLAQEDAGAVDWKSRVLVLLGIVGAILAALYFFGTPWTWRQEPMDLGKSWVPGDDRELGRPIIVKFMAPWCKHCRRLQPTWAKLTREFENSSSVFVTHVDCVAERRLCEKLQIRGLPTIRYGDPNDLQEYKGGRSLHDLVRFAAAIKPKCGPLNPDLCDEAQRSQLEIFGALGEEALESKLEAARQDAERIEAFYRDRLEELKRQTEEAQKMRQEALLAQKEKEGVHLARAVLAQQRLARRKREEAEALAARRRNATLHADGARSQSAQEL
eukprot:TRINITY_DN19640_c0_g6_i1.p1 TRINITY_DN19640_c0_g6~~TRINITY_DN19640_c0_g6_i1.p1  ORF type:complete len:360 (+),score=105.89 TRINITY_DN19640_c0_g6_i1:88-1080(+)